MRVFDAFTDFKQEILDKRHDLGFQEWTVVQIHELSAEDRESLSSVKIEDRETVCLVTIVNATTHVDETVLLKDDGRTYEAIRQVCIDEYIKDLPHRIVGIDPKKDKAFTEYESWRQFSDDWLVQDGKLVAPDIVPLLFDLPSDIEYLSWKKSGLIDITYRRLIVTLYAYTTGEFFSVFVKAATKENIEQYIKLLNAQKGLANVWR